METTETSLRKLKLLIFKTSSLRPLEYHPELLMNLKIVLNNMFPIEMKVNTLLTPWNPKTTLTGNKSNINSCNIHLPAFTSHTSEHMTTRKCVRRTHRKNCFRSFAK
uniref:Uncharacterized protein n=1 Tax=Cacopsylla melanoneura TaxID=428564 RepID=A0A8D9A1V9_9HEMI